MTDQLGDIEGRDGIPSWQQRMPSRGLSQTCKSRLTNRADQSLAAIEADMRKWLQANPADSRGVRGRRATYEIVIRPLVQRSKTLEELRRRGWLHEVTGWGDHSVEARRRVVEHLADCLRRIANSETPRVGTSYPESVWLWRMHRLEAAELKLIEESRSC